MHRIRRITNYGSTLLEKASVWGDRGLTTITKERVKSVSGKLPMPRIAFRAVRFLKPEAASQAPERKGFSTTLFGKQTRQFQDVNRNSQGPQVSISDDRRTLTIIDEHGNGERFNATWLRESCCCHICIEPQSGQRTQSATDLDPYCTLEQVHIEGENLIVKWNGDEHTGILGLQFLAKHTYSRAARRKATQDAMPLTSTGELHRIDYETVTGSGEGLWRWIRTLNEYGLCIVEGVPPTVQAKEMGSMIGVLKVTAFGVDYVVKTRPNASNLSYTTKALDTHIDSPYYEAIPGHTMLICREFDDCVTGGESIFVDAWHEAERLRELYPEDFEVLSRVPATFHVLNDERRMGGQEDYLKYRRPHFNVDKYTGRISGIYWCSFSQGPLFVDEDDINPYYEAYAKFAKMLETSDTKIIYRLKKGELLSFHNKRYLHGRNAYEENGGRRILEGCHLCADSVKSRAQVHSNLYNNGKPVKHVFNQDAF